MKKTLDKRKGNAWCRLRVELEAGRLSITSASGTVVPRAKAQELALEYWRSFLEDSPEELGALLSKFPREMCACMAERQGVSPEEAAAHFIIDTDGEFHGLDVDHEDGDDIYIMESCGCGGDDLLSFFPEVEPYLKWHLNDMKAGCEHQEALGWGRGRDVALDRATCSAPQLAVLDAEAEAGVARKREAFIDKYLAKCEAAQRKAAAASHLVIEMWKAAGRVQARLEHGDQPFSSAIFKDSLLAPCPEYGYRYGSQWLRRELPGEVIAWVESL